MGEQVCWLLMSSAPKTPLFGASSKPIQIAFCLRQVPAASWLTAQEAMQGPMQEQLKPLTELDICNLIWSLGRAERTSTFIMMPDARL